MTLSIKPLVKCSMFTLRVAYFCSYPFAAFCQPGRFWMLVSVVTRNSIAPAAGLGSVSVEVVPPATPHAASNAEELRTKDSAFRRLAYITSPPFDSGLETGRTGGGALLP